MEIKKLLRDKRGVMGLDVAKAFFILLIMVAVLGFAGIIIMGTLDDTDVLTPGSYGANQTTHVLNNVSSGISEFFEDTPTWLQLLSIVVIIAIVSAVIIYVTRFKAGGRGL